MKIFFAASQSRPALTAPGTISRQVEPPCGRDIKIAMNMVMSNKMVNAVLIHSVNGRIKTGSQKRKLASTLPANENKKRVGPTNASTNRIARPRCFQAALLSLACQMSFSAWVNA